MAQLGAGLNLQTSDEGHRFSRLATARTSWLQRALMPEWGRWVPVYLCAALYIADGGGDRTQSCHSYRDRAGYRAVVAVCRAV